MDIGPALKSKYVVAKPPLKNKHANHAWLPPMKKSQPFSDIK
jgi:hypothetical protein